MKTFTCFLLGLCLSLPILAQEKSDVPQLPPEELDKLVAPIALYPDSLIALVLPASTTSAEIVLAARFLARGGESLAIDNQAWSESVKSLARFPDLVAWMDENLAWTQQMGEVFEAQPADVMNAIQRLREQARAAGLLTDTPQQKVVMQERVICIVPAEPDIIYVPRYDPEILWMRRPYHGSFMTFGVGFGIGSWLHFDCDWFGRSIWMHHRSPGWVYRPGWRRPTNEVHVVVGSPWRPDFRHNHHARPVHRPMTVAVRPHVMNDRTRDYHRGNLDRSNRSVTPPSSFHRPSPPVPPSNVVTPPPAGRPPHMAGSQSGAHAPSRQTGRSMSPPNGLTPPQSGRPPHVAGPHSQSPRERPQGLRGQDAPPPSMQTPRPPSHTPPAASPPRSVPPSREPAPSAAPAPATRRSGRGESSGRSAPTVVRPPEPSQAPKPAARENAEKQLDGSHGGRNFNRR